MKTIALTSKAVQGVGWSGISKFSRLILQFGITAVLARLLTPKDFGLMAMIAVFTNLVVLFRDFGLTYAIIQRKELTEEHLSSCFWVNVFTGFILSILLCAFAPIIAYFYNEKKITSITIAISSTFFISSLSIVQTALFTKELKFKQLAIIEILGVTIAGVVAAVLAFIGFGVWSLVWQQIVGSVIPVILMWYLSNWKPKFMYKWEKIKDLVDFGLNLTGFNFINYFSRNLDKLLIGKYLGPASLGYYDLAYKLLLFPLNNISEIIGRVMFPLFSAIQDEKKRVSSVFIKSTQYIAALSFPLMFGLLIVASQFIIVIFGPQWKRSIFLVQIMAPLGIIQSIATLTGLIYLSQGRADLLFRVGFIFTVIIAVSFILGINWDVEGLAISYAIADFFIIYPCLAIPFSLIDLKVGYFIKQFKSISLATLGMGGIVFGFRLFLENILKTSDLVTLIACVVTGVICYNVFLFLINRDLYREVLEIIGQLKTVLGK